MWYFAVCSQPGAKRRTWIAYARSQDGLNWEKPKLGCLEINGNRANNAVFAPQGWRIIDFSGVIKDPNPNVPDSERYKLILPAQNLESKQKAYPLVHSPDGIHWTLRGSFIPGQPANPDRACLVLDPFREVYALYNRYQYAPRELVERGRPVYWGRAVALCTSTDFVNWSKSELVMHADADDADGTEIYGIATFPYEGQWVGLPQIYRSLPHLATIDVSISHSRDGKGWQREKEVVLPCGSIGEWDRFIQSPSTCAVRVGDELWVYYSGRLYRHGEYQSHTNLKDSGPSFGGIGLATLRLDGWCSLQASFDGGCIVTKALILPNGDLFINAKSDWGTVVVEVLQADGNPIDGMQSEPVSADGVHLLVQQLEGHSLSHLAGKPIRLRFLLNNALLYFCTLGRLNSSPMTLVNSYVLSLARFTKEVDPKSTAVKD